MESCMTLRTLLVVGLVALLTTSCMTRALWKATNPSEEVLVRQTAVSESELQKKGVRYHRNDDNGMFVIEKSGLRRFGDYTIRVLAVPVTAAVDAAPFLVYIG